MCIRRLDWDSDFFGYEVGKVIIPKGISLNATEFYEDAQKFKITYVFSEQEQRIKNLRLVDIKTLLSQSIVERKKSKTRNESVSFFDPRRHNFEDLKELAIASGELSRFNIDKDFKNNEFKRLYVQWIENAVEDSASDVLVYFDGDELLGLTTLKEESNKLSNIGLVAVRADTRGKGVGQSLIDASIKLAKKKGYSEIQVVTQHVNQPAIRLYEKCGFVITQKTYVYHYWNI